MLMNMTCFIKEDSIMFNLSQNKEAEAMRLIDKLYDKSEDRQEILYTLKKQVKK